MKLIAVVVYLQFCLLAALPAVIATDGRDPPCTNRDTGACCDNCDEDPDRRLAAKESKRSKSRSREKPFYSFILGELEDCATDPGRLAEIVADLGGNMEGDFSVVQDVLPLNKLRALRDHADSALEKALHIQQQQTAGHDLDHDLGQLPVKGADLNANNANLREDYRFELSPAELASFVGVDSLRSMYSAFKDYAPDYPVTRIIVRRTDLDGDKHIQYHNDGDTAVMHIWLNEDNAIKVIEGGNLVYLNKNGATKVDTKPGAASLHKDKIVHGITPLNGTRYILILLSDNKLQDDVMEALVA